MRKRRFIYNNDGTFILGNSVHGGRPLSPQDVTDYVDQVAGTPVTSYFICTNSAMPYYDSAIERSYCCKGADQDPGPGISPLGDHAHMVRLGENIQRLKAQGTDVVELCVNRAHERGMEAFGSVRMNDLHQAAPAVYHPWTQGDFWLAHPEYRVGEPYVRGMHANGALDFSHEAVRRYKLSLMEEICRRFDIDGLELDLLRFPLYFTCGEGERHMPLMTAFIREVRRMTAKVGAERGRPMELAVRVPRSLSHCRWLGLDVAAWAGQGLIDFVTTGAFFRDDPALPLQTFREELGTAALPVYGSMDCIVARPGMPNEKERRNHGMYRAAAAHLHRQGADGLYLFNFFFKSNDDDVTGKVGQMGARSLLFEMADAASLRGRNKCYAAATSLDEYGFQYDRDLPRTVAAGEETELTLMLAEEFAQLRPRRAIVFLRARGGNPASVRVNGAPLVQACAAESVGDFGRDHTLGADQHVHAWEAPVALLRDGGNQIVVTAGGSDVELLWADLVLDYGDPPQAGWY